MAVKPIPEGYQSVVPYLVVPDVKQLLQFLVQAFQSEEIESVTLPDGKVMHSTQRINDSVVMIGQSREDIPAMSTAIYLYVDDVDKAFEQAVAAGGDAIMNPSDQFYGDRNAGIKDPAGNLWWLARHIEDVPADEIAKRAADMMTT